MKYRVPRKIKKLIPKGVYCYKLLRFDSETHTCHIEPCKFYSHIKCKDKPVQDELDKEFPEQVVGWCKFLKGEIDDQCKNCGVKYGF